MGHVEQMSFAKVNWKHRFSAGGILRKKRAGRKQRPLSTKESVHMVLKLNRSKLKSKSLRSPPCFKLSLAIIRTYAKKFHIKLEQFSIQNDHIHFLIRTNKRSQFHYFFRVVPGQIAQRFEQEGFLKVTDTPENRNHQLKRGLGLWTYRPFSRVVPGYKAYLVVRDYIQLNEKEARGIIPYRKERLRGLSMGDWKILWN